MEESIPRFEFFLKRKIREENQNVMDLLELSNKGSIETNLSDAIFMHMNFCDRLNYVCDYNYSAEANCNNFYIFYLTD